MIIFDHIIPDRFIVGIGPLIFQENKIEKERFVHESFRYTFELHLAGHTTFVTSKWFRPKDNADEQQHAKAWKLKYISFRQQVMIMLGEKPEEDLKPNHNEEVDRIHSEGLELFDELMNELQPAEDGREQIISVKTQKVVDALLDLKHMAAR